MKLDKKGSGKDELSKLEVNLTGAVWEAYELHAPVWLVCRMRLWAKTNRTRHPEECPQDAGICPMILRVSSQSSKSAFETGHAHAHSTFKRSRVKKGGHSMRLNMVADACRLVPGVWRLMPDRIKRGLCRDTGIPHTSHRLPS